MDTSDLHGRTAVVTGAGSGIGRALVHRAAREGMGVVAADVEQQALDAYTEFLPRVAGDPVLEPFVRKQIEIEAEHVQSIRDTIRTTTPLSLVQKRAAAADRKP